MTTIDERLAVLREQIECVAPAAARQRQQAGALLLDVREPDEIAAGLADGAEPIGRGFLEFRIGKLADRTRPLLVMCGTSARSLLAADELLRLGYRQVAVVDGGFQAWKQTELPWHVLEAEDADCRQRYARQLQLSEIGAAGQARLADARVLLVGAGGLGSPAALYLAAAGIGTLGIVDDDRVERSNLHRQVLHRDDRVGWPKTDSARATLTALNPRVTIQTHALRLDAGNVEDVMADYNIVVDGSDNFPTRYLVTDACLRLNKPCVYGAVQGFEGQIALFPAGGRPCYRCLFSAPPAPEHAPSCAEAGVLGVVPGIIGMLQALEVMKWLLGLGESLAGRLLLFDARTIRLREVRIAPDPDCVGCAPGRPPIAYTDYAGFCQGSNDV
ncbi:MAG: molybdopterin-synthase adenylyltransferase MoeB [Wenzhouxiangellaceae bacterium]|nr:molybdopterin-synthase adenylyltransferase MoeB [Wenzhouxiangellaceae bacterium]